MNISVYRNVTYTITLNGDSKWVVTIPFFGYVSKGFDYFIQAESDAKDEIDKRG